MIVPAVRAIERFLLPNACVACSSAMPASHPDALICGVCLARMRPVVSGCGRCGNPLPPVGPCRFCADWHEVLEAVASAVWLGPEARRLVHELKYGEAKRLADVAAGIIDRRVPVPMSDVMIPVPSGPRRLMRRGYNQAALIAEALGARWKLPVSLDVLTRRDTTSQTTLSPTSRAANVQGTFVATAPRAGGNAVVVDDVLTTGATIDAAAGVLRDAGWRRVVAVTFARTPSFDVKLMWQGVDR